MPMQRAGADRGGGAHVAIVGDRCDAYFPLRFQAFCDTASVMGTSTTASTAIHARLRDRRRLRRFRRLFLCGFCLFADSIQRSDSANQRGYPYGHSSKHIGRHGKV